MEGESESVRDIGGSAGSFFTTTPPQFERSRIALGTRAKVDEDFLGNDEINFSATFAGLSNDAARRWF